MAVVCCYFQMHQPYRLRRYSVFDTEPNYFDTERNEKILDQVVERCYDPGTKLLADLIDRHDAQFRVSVSMSGTLLDQLTDRHPHVLERLGEMANTGAVEFLAETYHHSLAFLYSRDEFSEQVAMHADRVLELFGQTPRVFRNTELIYNNDLAHYLASKNQYVGVLAEGADQVLGDRPPTSLYQPPHAEGLNLLLKHYRLSDDIAFRFSDRGWSEWPLTADKFAGWVGRAAEREGAGGTAVKTDGLVNLFMDFETFGEHQDAKSGIWDFLGALPGALFDDGHEMVTVGEAFERFKPRDSFDAPHMISWADTERDLSAWLGNAMQSNALHELYKLERPVKATGDMDLLCDWRRLSTSDHVYYMCTKYFADGDVHRYFNPYESPYDSYINFMNVLDNLRSRAGV